MTAFKHGCTFNISNKS